VRNRLLIAATGLAVLIALLVAWPDPVEAVPLHGTFIDDNNSVHQNGIEAMAAAGITVGCNPPTYTRFCPKDNVTRAQAATFLARALDLPSDGVDYFVDDNGHTLEGGINKLAASEITRGCNPPDNDRFCPESGLTRAQFAAFIARGMELDPTTTDHFVDDNGHVLEASINRIAEAGITVGCNPPANDRFCPDQRITREQIATLLTRALGLPHNPLRIPLSNWNAIRCDRIGTTCSVNIETSAGRTHLVQEGFFQMLPYQSGEEAEFMGSGTAFSLSLDGDPVSLTALPVSSSSTQALRRWDTLLVFSEGAHTLVGEWRWEGSVVQRVTARITAG
jgi:hypothetical protein